MEQCAILWNNEVTIAWQDTFGIKNGDQILHYYKLNNPVMSEPSYKPTKPVRF